jgi:hypothetical protein
MDAVLEAFQADLHRFVAERAPRRYFIHAGVVGWKGCAILIPGRSFSGKSTLVSEFVRAGAEYYSDEYAVFDDRGRVHPFPRALALRISGQPNQAEHSPESLGGAVGTKPLRPGLVLVSRYRSGAQWRPRRLTPGQGLLALLGNSVSARRDPRRVLESLCLGVEGATAVRGLRGEARDLVPAILEYLDRRGTIRASSARSKTATAGDPIETFFRTRERFDKVASRTGTSHAEVIHAPTVVPQSPSRPDTTRVRRGSRPSR